MDTKATENVKALEKTRKYKIRVRPAKECSLNLESGYYFGDWQRSSFWRKGEKFPQCFSLEGFFVLSVWGGGWHEGSVKWDGLGYSWLGDVGPERKPVKMFSFLDRTTNCVTGGVFQAGGLESQGIELGIE